MLHLVLYFSLALFFFIQSTFAFETIGLHKLNPFPKDNWVSRTYLKYEQTNINLQQAMEDQGEIKEYHHLFEQEIGYRLSDATFFSTSLQYGQSKLSSLRYGDSDKGSFYAQGFSEPTFKLFSRRRFAEKVKDKVIDLFVSFSPKLNERATGASGSNMAHGRNISRFEINHGIFDELWDFNFKLNYLHFGEGEEKDLNSKNIRKFNAYSELAAYFEAQHYLTEMYFVRAGMGLRYISDQHFSEAGKNSDVQQGTGSSMYLGLVRKGKVYTLISKIGRLRNDYFIKGSESNMEGDYTFRSLSFEVLREF
jgi:hypothetical protein